MDVCDLLVLRVGWRERARAGGNQRNSKVINNTSNHIPKKSTRINEFAGPCAQGVLDTVIVPCPMSLGCTGLIDSIVLLKDNAFLGTSAHESVTLAGYLLATCWLPVGYLLILVVCRTLKSNENPAVKRGSAAHGRIWAHLGPSWNQLGPTWDPRMTTFSRKILKMTIFSRKSHEDDDFLPKSHHNDDFFTKKSSE